MNPTNTPLFVRRWMDNKEVQFWSLQIMGWLGIFLVTHFNLTLWYNEPELPYIAHNALQSLLGMLLTWPMRPIFRRLWNSRPAWRFLAIFATVFLLSMAWAALRLPLFMQLTGEQDLWADFGGWFNSSFFIFACWTALYHSIKYYQLLQQEHQNVLQLRADQQLALLQRTEAESETRQAQLKLLLYQLNPHFLFNTLNSLLSLVRSGKSDRAQEMIIQLSHFLRYSLKADRSLLAPLSEEIDALKKYLDIEQIRFGDRLTVTTEIAPETLACEVPTMLLQPLVENSIKYAIAKSECGGTIAISSALFGESLQICVDDSGAGDANLENNVVEGTGLGLRNTRQRLQAHFGDRFRMTFSDSLLGGLRIKLELPTDNLTQPVSGGDP